MKSFLQYLKEGRESLERRWRDINYAMAQVTPTTNPMDAIFDFPSLKMHEPTVNLGGDFPIKIKPFSLSPTAGVHGEFEYAPPAGRKGVIRLDPQSSQWGSPIVWHEMGHGSANRSLDTALFPGDKAGTSMKRAIGSKDLLRALKASLQKAVPYLIRNSEMDARAIEYGKTAKNAARESAETMQQQLRKVIAAGKPLAPSTEMIKGAQAHLSNLVDWGVKRETLAIGHGLSTPVDTPVPIGKTGVVRPPTPEEIKIRTARARQGPQLLKRAIGDAASMITLGYEEALSPAIIKSVIRNAKKETGAKQVSPANWEQILRDRMQTRPVLKAASIDSRSISKPKSAAFPAAQTKTGMRLPGALGVAGAFLPLAFGASPAEAAEAAVHGLNPLSMFGDTPAGLGSDQVDYGDGVTGKRIEFGESKPKPKKGTLSNPNLFQSSILNWSPEINEQRKNSVLGY